MKAVRVAHMVRPVLSHSHAISTYAACTCRTRGIQSAQRESRYECSSQPQQGLQPSWSGVCDGAVLRCVMQAEAVERFVIVHGQVILNQFKNYPVKAVRESAFVAALRTRMQQRRHSKLYMAAKGKLKAGLNRNPMRDRGAGRPKPMTATATTMVKSIWASYFTTASPGMFSEPARR